MTSTRRPKTPTTPVKEPGLFDKFNAYVKKNQTANKKLGEPSLTEELSSFGSEWSKNLAKGMSQVGDQEEKKIMGTTKKNTGSFQDDNDHAQDVLFGSKKPKTNSQQQPQERVIRNEPLVADDGELQITFLESGNLIIRRASGAGLALDPAEQKRVYTLLKKLIG